MTLALRLRQAGHDVTLFEAADEFGGLAAAWDIGGLTWDKHYHVTLLSDLNLRAVLGELGLEEEMKWVETKTGFYTGGQHYSMSSSVEFLRFPPLTLVEKVRLGATIFFASKIKDWRKLEGVTAAEWLEKWSGKGVFQKIWLPLLRAKLGDNYHLASAAFIWAIIARMYAARRSGLKKEMFGYLAGGYAAMLDRFADALRQSGVDLRPSNPIERVAAGGAGGVSVQFPNGAHEEFDRCALTLPSPIVSKLCPDLSPREHGLLNGIRYQGIVCASLLLRKPLEGYYVTNITDDVPFTAVIEMTALVDPKELGGHHLVYLPWYVDASDSRAFETTDSELHDRFWTALKAMHPKLSDEDLVEFKVSRARNVMALSTLGYSQSLPPRDTSIDGVHIVNSAMICNGTLNVNETIGIAEEAVPELAAMSAARKGAVAGA
jgi:protoporphyrinogen oxidase